jgi:hypothetical protein
MEVIWLRAWETTVTTQASPQWPEEDSRRTVQMVHVVSENINRQTGLTLVLCVLLTVAIGLLYPLVTSLIR